MATYEYENAAGERREIVASMKNPPPEVVRFDGDEWHPLMHTTPDWPEQSKFRRVYSAPMIHVMPGGEVSHPHQAGKPPTSVSLPRAIEKDKNTGLSRLRGNVVNRSGHEVREIAPKLYTTLDGRRIIDSKSSGDRHAADCGYVRTRDD